MTRSVRLPIAVMFALVLSAMWFAAAAQAEICGERADILRNLGDSYGEARWALGVVPGKSLVEIFVSEKTRTWTILETSPQGRTCLMTAGEGFQIDPLIVGTGA